MKTISKAINDSAMNAELPLRRALVAHHTNLLFTANMFQRVILRLRRKYGNSNVRRALMNLNVVLSINEE